MSEAAINVHEAKTNLSKLLARVEEGETIVLSRSGKPVARIVPFLRGVPARKPGAWKGKVWISPDFDEVDEQIIEMFEGKRESKRK